MSPRTLEELQEDLAEARAKALKLCRFTDIHMLREDIVKLAFSMCSILEIRYRIASRCEYCEFNEAQTMRLAQARDATSRALDAYEQKESEQ
jgi:hypothetical protein